METAEKQHAKRVEQILASINKNLEKIAKSLEKMEPIYLTTLTAEEEKTSEPRMPTYCRDCLSNEFKP